MATLKLPGHRKDWYHHLLTHTVNMTLVWGSLRDTNASVWLLCISSAGRSVHVMLVQTYTKAALQKMGSMEPPPDLPLTCSHTHSQILGCLHTDIHIRLTHAHTYTCVSIYVHYVPHIQQKNVVMLNFFFSKSTSH